jgi:tetratricopeptide (TPR) repeat protein
LFWIVLIAALILAAPSWYLWSYYSAPPLPQIAIEGMDAPVEAAVAKATAQVRRSPRSGPAWGHLGMVLAIHGDREGSRYCFVQARGFDPTNPRWPYLLGHSYLPDAGQALPFLEQGVDLADRFDSGNSAPRLLLGETFFLSGQYAGARREFETVLRDAPDNPRAHYNLGLVEVAVGDPQAALKHLMQSVGSPAARQKSSSRLAALHGALAAQAGIDTEEGQRHAQAAARYQEASRGPADTGWADPYLREVALLDRRPSHYYERAATMLAAGQTEEAVAFMDQVVEMFPNEDSAYLELARALLAARQYDRAEEAARQTLTLRPDRAQGQYFLGEALFRQGVHTWNTQPADRAAARGKFQEAEEHLRTATELMPNHPRAHVYRGRCLRYLDRHAEAAGAFRAAIQHNPRQVEAYVFLSNLLAEDGKKSEARGVLQEGQQALPQSRELQAALERLSPGDPPQPR